VKEPNSNSFSFKSYPQLTDFAESPLFIFFGPFTTFLCCMNFFALHVMGRKKIADATQKN
jgi:hypothetical protein